jgi:TonB family protein
MFQRLLLISAVSVLVANANQAGPSEFYIVSASISDYANLSYFAVLDVRQEGPDSIVRCIRIGPRSVPCPLKTLQAVETRVPNTTPGQLVGTNNPCVPKASSLKSAAKKRAERTSGQETISFGIVAHCEGAFVSLTLPTVERVNWKRLKAASSEIPHLWDLYSEVADRVFGSKDIFLDRSEQDDLTLQQAGNRLVPELVAGRYDFGLAAAVKGNIDDWRNPSFKKLLEDYRGPVRISDANDVPRLLNPDQYQFTRYVAPAYPPLARLARVEGKVELRLSVDHATGDVNAVAVVSGHPLLKDSAVAAAEQWRFVPNFVTAETVNLTLDYSIRCPLVLQTQITLY